MIYFTIVFLCTAGLFLALLQDRFRVWTTLAAAVAGYVLSLLAAFFLRRIVQDPVLAQQLPCAAGAFIFFVLSLIFCTNNVLQKLFVALLSLCNFTFLGFFLPLLLGVMPFDTAGAFAGFFSAVLYLLFSLLMGLCLYHPLRHYSDRGASGFLLGMCLLLLGIYLFSRGTFDFLFRTNIFAARLLVSTLLYGALIFAFRSMYQAGRFRERTATIATRSGVADMETYCLANLLSAMKEVQSAQRYGTYALDTVAVLLADGNEDRIPEYIATVKENFAHTPSTERYHENPFLNAVLALKASLAAQNGISFECNAVTGNAPLKIAEICMIADEMLTKACLETAVSEGDKKVRFTVFPAGDALTLEAVYSSPLPQREKFTFRGKKASDVLEWLFEENTQSPAGPGLTHTEELLSLYGGKLTVSGTVEETILQVNLRF